MGAAVLESHPLSLVELGCVCHPVAQQLNLGCSFSGVFIISSLGAFRGSLGACPGAMWWMSSQQNYRPLIT